MGSATVSVAPVGVSPTESHGGIVHPGVNPFRTRLNCLVRAKEAHLGFCAHLGVASWGAPRKLSGLPLTSGQSCLLSRCDASVDLPLPSPDHSAGRRTVRPGRSRSPNRMQLSGLPLASSQRRLLSRCVARVSRPLPSSDHSAGRRMVRPGRSRSPNRMQRFSCPRTRALSAQGGELHKK